MVNWKGKSVFLERYGMMVYTHFLSICPPFLHTFKYVQVWPGYRPSPPNKKYDLMADQHLTSLSIVGYKVSHLIST
jgi:hypothetical protein